MEKILQKEIISPFKDPKFEKKINEIFLKKQSAVSISKIALFYIFASCEKAVVNFIS